MLHTRRWATAAALLLVATLAVVACRSSKGGPEPEQIAIKQSMEAVNQFHSALSSGNASQICGGADANAFKSVTQLPCAEFVGWLNGKLGSFTDGKRDQIPMADQKPLRVELRYSSQYQRGEAQETFDYRIVDGKPKLMQYRVDSAAVR